MSECRLSPHAKQILACPICCNALADGEDHLTCNECDARFALHRGIPILLDENSSLFGAEQVIKMAAAEGMEGMEGGEGQRPGLRLLLRNLVPSLTRNAVASRNYKELLRILCRQAQTPLVLVIGAGDGGAGSRVWSEFPWVELILTDIYIGPRTHMVCDAHSLPIRTGSVDAVIMQAVVDDLVRPDRAIAEVFRVLRPGGLVYAETPFLQPVHDGAFDFQRFTHLGHRKLFRHFEEIRSGAVGGAAQAMALAYHALVMSFAVGRRSRAALSLFAHFSGWWLKYLDCLTSRTPAALDAASGCFFLGRRSNTPLSDRELIAQYRGAQQRTWTASPLPAKATNQKAPELAKASV